MSHRILIVDDEAGIRQALKQVLEYEGHTVSVAGGGGEAVGGGHAGNLRTGLVTAHHQVM